MKSFLHWLRVVCVTTVLLAAVWFGIKEGFDGFTDAETPSQRAAGVLQILYGICAATALVALFTHRTWLRWPLLAWAFTVTATGTIAPIVWTSAPWSEGALAGAVTAAVAGLVAWGALAHARSRRRAGRHIRVG